MASETVSVVFTDLVGSTEILSRLGENRAEELRREFERGFALAEAQPDAPLFGGSQLGVFAYFRGHWEQGTELFEVALEEYELPALRGAYAGCLLHAARANDAREVARSLDGFDVHGTISRDPISGATLAGLALAAKVLSPTMLDRLASVLSGLRGQLLISGASIIWPADLGRALVLTELRRWDDAERDFASALEIAQSLSMPLAVAWAQWEWAEMLAQRGDPADEARIVDLAGAALVLAEAHGCSGVALACSALLESRG